MSPTIEECLENARQCESRTNDEEDRKFLLRRAKHWTKLAAEKEFEVQAAARLPPSSYIVGHSREYLTNLSRTEAL
jgi:hypothetical protein